MEPGLHGNIRHIHLDEEGLAEFGRIMSQATGENAPGHWVGAKRLLVTEFSFLHDHDSVHPGLNGAVAVDITFAVTTQAEATPSS